MTLPCDTPIKANASKAEKKRMKERRMAWYHMAHYEEVLGKGKEKKDKPDGGRGDQSKLHRTGRILQRR